jgi:hypothetical protein
MARILCLSNTAYKHHTHFPVADALVLPINSADIMRHDISSI